MHVRFFDNPLASGINNAPGDYYSRAVETMGMVSGILPVVGVPLPFISYGGTAMVTLGMGLGILMSIAKSKRLVQS